MICAGELPRRRALEIRGRIRLRDAPNLGRFFALLELAGRDGRAGPRAAPALEDFKPRIAEKGGTTKLGAIAFGEGLWGSLMTAVGPQATVGALQTQGRISQGKAALQPSASLFEASRGATAERRPASWPQGRRFDNQSAVGRMFGPRLIRAADKGSNSLQAGGLFKAGRLE